MRCKHKCESYTNKNRKCKKCTKEGFDACSIHRKYGVKKKSDQTVQVQQEEKICETGRNTERKEKEKDIINNFFNHVRLRPKPKDLAPPDVDHNFDQKLVERYIEEKMADYDDDDEKSKLEFSLRAFFNHSVYVSWKTFLAQFKKTLTNFFKTIGSTPYLLLIPLKLEGIDSASYLKKSNYWLSVLAYSLVGRRKPIAVCTPRQAIYDWPNVNNVLMVDDGIYSGQQMSVLWEYMNSLELKIKKKCPNLLFKKYYLTAPYCSEEATKLLMGIAKRVSTPSRFTILCNQRMIQLDKIEVTNPDTGEKEYLEDLSDFEIEPDMYPIVFQHKLPDDMSSYPEVYKKVLKNCDPNVDHCFIPHYKDPDYWKLY